MPLAAPERLVLFDIDGTLLWSDGSGRAAMQIALEQVYGTAGPIDAYNFAGRTDHQLVADLLTAGGVPADVIWKRFEQLGEVMAAELEQRVARGLHHICACPGRGTASAHERAARAADRQHGCNRTYQAARCRHRPGPISPRGLW